MKSSKSKILSFCFLGVWGFLFAQIEFNDSFQKQLLLLCAEHGFISPLMLVVTQIFFSTFFLPCSVLTLLAGVLWGWKLGMVYSVTATLTASLFTFLLGRFYLNKIIVPDGLDKIRSDINEAILKYGWKASFVVHINPFIPGSSLGYLFGGAKIDMLSFLLGAMVGTLPLQFLMVYSGGFMVRMANF